MDGNIEILLINYGLPLLGLIISSLASLGVKYNYSKYKKEPSSSNLTGAEVARKILDNNGLEHIKVNEVSGELTDHYDPTKKVVNLSTDIYHGKTIAATSVAAHECGHAIQDKVGYKPLRIRASLVPLVNFSTKFGYIIIVIGLAISFFRIAEFGLILLMSMLLFQLVTLPVEFNASSRAKQQLITLKLNNSDEQYGTSKMLKAAAMTYVASVATTFFEIFRIAAMVLGNRDRK